MYRLNPTIHYTCTEDCYNNNKFFAVCSYYSTILVVTDCAVICTSSTRHIHALPEDLIVTCHTAHMSRLATTATQSLPREV